MERLTLPADERVRRPLWRNLSFLLMWSSVAASGFSDRIIQLAALPMLGVAQEDAQAARITAGITFWFFFPYLLLMPPAGWIADRLPRKWIMFTCDEVRGLILLGAMVMAATQMPEDAGTAAIPEAYHWQVYAVIAATGAMAAFFLPARNATIPQIVPFAQLQRANALTFAISVIASLIGTLIGGYILGTWSVARALLIGAAAYLVSGTFFAFIRPMGQRRIAAGGGTSRSLRHALGYIRRHRGVVELILVDALIWGVANLLFATLAALVKNRYGFTEPDAFIQRFAEMSATAGAGMLVSAVVVGWMNFRRESSWFMVLALASAGACTLALALLPGYAVGLALAFGAGLFGNAAMVCAGTLLQTISPNYIRGRVFAVNSQIATLSAVAINFAIWRTPEADRWMVPAMLVAGGLLVIVGAAFAWRELRRGPIVSGFGNVLWRLNRWYALVWHRLRWMGRHHIPTTGPVILASNHTTGLDPLLIQAACPRVVRWVMLRSYEFRVLAPLWRVIRPVALEPGTREIGRIRQIVAALKVGDVVGLFPEGGLQREHRQLQRFHPGIAMIAQRSGAWVVPVWIAGTPRRRRMVWHFLQPSHSTVVFGEAYQVDPDAPHDQVLADLRERMLALSRAVEDTV